MPRLTSVLAALLVANLAAAQTAAPSASASAQANNSGGGIGDQGASGLGETASLNPPMIGDLGLRGLRLVTTPMTRTITDTRQVVVINSSGERQVVTIRTNRQETTFTQSRLPVAASSIKIAENESPRPLDRVFLAYNFYDNLGAIGAPGFDLHRETAGGEMTFLDGNASIGVRIPVQQVGNGPSLGIDGFGAASVIGKYAFLNDAETGNVFSAGLAVAMPTGPSVPLDGGASLDTTFLQPFVGFIFNAGAAFVHGFSSAVVATDDRDVTFLSNDIGLGYRLFEAAGDGFLSSVTPTLEAHVFTPLNNRGDADLIQAFDAVVLTGGATFGFADNRIWLTAAAALPIAGPRPYDVEYVAYLNWRF